MFPGQNPLQNHTLSQPAKLRIIKRSEVVMNLLDNTLARISPIDLTLYGKAQKILDNKTKNTEREDRKKYPRKGSAETNHPKNASSESKGEKNIQLSRTKKYDIRRNSE